MVNIKAIIFTFYFNRFEVPLKNFRIRQEGVGNHPNLKVWLENQTRLLDKSFGNRIVGFYTGVERGVCGDKVEPLFFV